MRALHPVVLAFASASLIAPALSQQTDITTPQASFAASTISESHLLEHIRTLSSDEYEGRGPGTAGEMKSVSYIEAQCRAIGLQPGDPDGSWTQQVPLWGMLSTGTLTLTSGQTAVPLQSGTDYVTWSSMPVEDIRLQPQKLVFVGYGVVAPRYRWDDYAGADVHGKTVIVLSGDPPVADPRDPAKLDENMFLGRALTIYGRTGTKLETAFQHGASAVVLITATPEATPTLFGNYTRETMILRGPHERDRVQAAALLSGNAATKVFRAAGEDFAGLKATAARPGFHAVDLPASADFEIKNRVRRVDSSNVLAKITGSDPKLKDEIVVYSGHWDHHGRVGNDIFHGASDNAAGTAGVLELARAFKSLYPAPRRTLLFLWPTAEEKGLLGARYYVEHPLYPLDKTVADINLDYFSNWGWGRTHDFSIVGLGNSTLDDVTTQLLKAQGRAVTGDTAPEQGFYFRSDHYEFARAGVPSIETSPGIDYVGKPAGYGAERRAEYIAHDYHQPTDVVKPDWDLRGALEDLQVLLYVGYQVAQRNERPSWKPDALWRPDK